MPLNHLDLALIPVWRHGYRLQFEAAQNCYVLLYPEGLIKLNESAGIIAQQINNMNSIFEIIQNIKAIFGDTAEIEQDIIDYIQVAQREFWIDLI